MLPREVINKIKSQIDIVDVVSEYINLERVGQYYRALCPFHTETRPSFFVSPKLQRYKCFGCGASGDVIKFVQEMENLSFYEALEKLAERVGIDLSKYQKASSNNELKRYIEFLKSLHEEYRKNLKDNTEVLEYLKDTRKLSDDDIENFELGFSPPDSSALIKVAKEMNADWPFLVRTGVVAGSRNNLIDLLRGRITFPIKNESGGVIAFGGRVVGDGEPKYLNSRDTRFFSKSRILYLFERAKQHIRKLDLVIITEGYFDAIAYHRAGFENSVAVLGTALTPHHASRLANLSKNAVLAFDSDEAGIKAALRSLDTLLSRGFEILVVDYGKLKDADETYQKFGKEGLESVLEKAVPYEEFIVIALSRIYDLSTASGLEKFAKSIGVWGKKILKYSSSARLKNLIEKSAEISGLEVRDIERFVKAKKNVESGIYYTHVSVDEILVFIFFNYEELREKILEIDRKHIGDKLKKILDAYEKTNDLNRVLDEVSNETGDWVFNALKNVPPPSDPTKALDDAIKKIKLKKLKERLKEIDKLLQTAGEEEKSILLETRMEIVRKIQTLQRG